MPSREMHLLTCLECGVSDTSTGDFLFEHLGLWSDGRSSVRRCRNCGTGFIARARRVREGYRLRRIEAAALQELQVRAGSDDHADPPADHEPPGEAEIRSRIRELQHAGYAGDTLLNLLAEWLGLSRDTTRVMLASAVQGVETGRANG
jgi:hypothetical protein